MSERCPTCQRPWRQPDKDRRVCNSCKQPILKGEKFRFVGPMVMHRDCKNPGRYPEVPK